MLGIIAQRALPNWTPADLFRNGELGAWYDPSDISTLFQDAGGTIPVTADGDPVGLVLDKSGNDNHASQPTTTARPLYRTDGTLSWLEYDGVDDVLVMPAITYNVPSPNFTISSTVTRVVDNAVFNACRSLPVSGFYYGLNRALDTSGSVNPGLTGQLTANGIAVPNLNQRGLLCTTLAAGPVTLGYINTQSTTGFGSETNLWQYATFRIGINLYQHVEIQRGIAGIGAHSVDKLTAWGMAKGGV